MNKTENVQLADGHTQVCVWPGTTLEEGQEQDFEQFLLEDLGARGQYLEQITTNPDDSGPGGRIDLFFAVHDDDIGKFAVPRLAYGMRWIEDAISAANGGNTLYPTRVEKYATW